MTRAVVFAYHDVGVRCLKTLLAGGVDVRLVVTHRDDPGERVWFASVADAARDYGLEVIAPDDANDDASVARVAACEPDFLFSFYFRRMLGPRLLALARRGAFNVHGSLLPRYRGRAPVNWAVLRGERETGATLHAMTAKPDDGAIVDQQAVPILPDDTAGEVFAKVTVAAEMVLDRSLPALIAGRAPMREQDASQASYFGGRRPEDGRIDWRAGARAVHDLVRAVAPPYPGAFAQVDGSTLRLLRTLRVPAHRCGGSGAATPAPARAPDAPAPCLFACDGRLYLRFPDGELLRVLDAQFDGAPLDARTFSLRFGVALPLTAPAASGGPEPAATRTEP